MQYGYSPFVVREACGDRHQVVNDNNLFDMDSKFAEVVLEEEMMTMINGLQKLWLRPNQEVRRESTTVFSNMGFSVDPSQINVT